MLPAKKLPGEPVDYSSISQNDTVDAIEELRKRQFTEEVNDYYTYHFDKGQIIFMKNSSDSIVPQYGVLEIEVPRDWRENLMTTN